LSLSKSKVIKLIPHFVSEVQLASLEQMGCARETDLPLDLREKEEETTISFIVDLDVIET
jgi:antitoxin component of RelBE/YafQ-DinJ toxin-antitoxin module